jgi:hypothetical protein
MSLAKQHLEQAIQALHNANSLQQKAFAAYKGALPEDEDVCYQIHNDIENVIMALEEVLDCVEEDSASAVLDLKGFDADECVDYWGEAVVNSLLDADGELVEVLGEATDGFSDIRLADGTEVGAINNDFLKM